MSTGAAPSIIPDYGPGWAFTRADERLWQQIGEQVEREWGVSGLSAGIYKDWAIEIAKRWLQARRVAQ